MLKIPQTFHATIFFCLLYTYVLAYALHAQAQAIDTGSEVLYEQAVKEYELRHYKNAQSILQQAIALDATQARYHHLLGKSYGRAAEESRWFITKIRYARKTVQAFERALILDNTIEQLLLDLIDFHQQAPEVAGGDPDRLVALQRQLEVVQKAQNDKYVAQPEVFSETVETLEN